MRRACVIGWPIEHSRSPSFTVIGCADTASTAPTIASRYGPIMRASSCALLAMRSLLGCNVTVPHKEVAFRVADEKDKSAVAVGAANTVWLDGGRLCCANTDTYGYMTHLTLRAPNWKKRDAPVSILGAGGAARAIIYGFLSAGVSRVRVFNRTRQRAEALASTSVPPSRSPTGASAPRSPRMRQ